VEQLLNAIQAKQNKMIRFLEQLVNIDSGNDSPEGVAKVARMIGDKLQEMEFGVEYLEYPGACTHLLAKKKGTGSKEVMIIGHMDTLFPAGTATERPFTIKDGKAYGPGVLDMKGGITIALFALEALYESGWNDKNVTVFFAGDEEFAHPKTNAPELFEQYAKGKDAVFNMETASAGRSVLVGRKGNIHPELIVKGISAHAGADLDKGASAIVELAHKIIAVNNLTDFSRGLTFNCGVIKGGTVANAVADYASVVIDMRYLNSSDGAEGIESLRKIAAQSVVIGTSCEVANLKERFTPMEVTEGNLKLYEIVKEQGKKLGLDIEKKVGGGASDAGWTVRAGAPSICSMGALGALNHSDREYIVLDGLVERAKLLALSVEAV
jgi:glutamate carboxypeptidase